MNIGPKLKALRQKNKLTIKELAQKTGLSAGFISNIERDINSPTISSLQLLCEALGISVGDLFNIEEGGCILFRSNDEAIETAVVNDKTSYKIFPLPNKKMRASIITLKPGGIYGGGLLRHAGEEIGIVLKGSIEYQVNSRFYILRAGDCIFIESLTPHRFRNIGNNVATTFWVTLNA